MKQDDQEKFSEMTKFFGPRLAVGKSRRDPCERREFPAE